ncbi:MAG: hypothetical protein V3V67_14495, partial [Myxococcota bacterium]
MSNPDPVRVHVIAGGFPPGSPAAHDMDYARIRILQLLQERPHIRATVANDFDDVEKWLEGARLLITYVAGPFPSDEQNEFICRWLGDGGHWLGLHGTSGGRAARVGEKGLRRKMVK